MVKIDLDMNNKVKIKNSVKVETSLDYSTDSLSEIMLSQGFPCNPVIKISMEHFISTFLETEDKNFVKWDDLSQWILSHRDLSVVDFIAPRVVWVEIFGHPDLEFEWSVLEKIVK